MTPHLDADLAVTLSDDRPGMLAKAISCVSAAGNERERAIDSNCMRSSSLSINALLGRPAIAIAPLKRTIAIMPVINGTVH